MGVAMTMMSIPGGGGGQRSDPTVIASLNKKYRVARGEIIFLFEYENVQGKNLKIETVLWCMAIRIRIRIQSSWIQVRIFHLSLCCRQHSQLKNVTILRQNVHHANTEVSARLN